jgi:hypothetical protein
METYGGVEYSSTILWRRHQMEVSDQLHAPVALMWKKCHCKTVISGRWSVRISAGTLAITIGGSCGFPQSLKQITEEYLDQAMPALFQIVSNSSFICHPKIRRYSTRIVWYWQRRKISHGKYEYFIASHPGRQTFPKKYEVWRKKGMNMKLNKAWKWEKPLVEAG